MKLEIVLVAIGLIIGMYAGGIITAFYMYQPQQATIEINAVPEGRPVTVTPFAGFGNLTNESAKVIRVPAVDEDGNGVSTVLFVQAAPGSGRALVSIDNILFFTDTQSSIRTAKKVAEDVTGMDTSKFDIIYSIDAEASIIEGPSAGAALTIATIAAIEGRDIRPGVTITGTVNHDGTIGPVGGILEKAAAAKEAGADTFLVPLGQGSQVSYRTERHCEQVGRTEVCTVEQIPQKVNVESQAGINIVEAGTIKEALEYFLE
ncbi:MAG: hypothetical protein HY518_04065 [Candidatus Aenigmarchaeota archaeon]|nr:hypothetical protein [Candidatus Aenigmarchaeota archaeon]